MIMMVWDVKQEVYNSIFLAIAHCLANGRIMGPTMTIHMTRKQLANWFLVINGKMYGFTFRQAEK